MRNLPESLNGLMDWWYGIAIPVKFGMAMVFLGFANVVQPSVGVANYVDQITPLSPYGLAGFLIFFGMLLVGVKDLDQRWRFVLTLPFLIYILMTILATIDPHPRGAVSGLEIRVPLAADVMYLFLLDMVYYSIRTGEI